MAQLSTGVAMRLSKATSGEDPLFDEEHTIQLLSIKKVAPSTGVPGTTSSSPDRYRLIISDGEYFVQAMLATQLNSLVAEDKIGKNSIARITKMTCNFVQEKRLVIVLDLVVEQLQADKVGSPVAIEIGGNVPAAGAAPALAAEGSNAPPARAPVVQQQQQAPRAPAPSRPAGKAASIYPIEGLSPYQNNWTIKARVTKKSEIRHFSNNRGEGKIFDITLMDESGEIKATGFNAAVDELFDRIEENKVYFVSKARVNLAKKKFSTINNDYELALDKTTIFDECTDTTNLPTVKYNFIPLSQLETVEKDGICDVIGVVKEAGPLSEITSKAARQISKRELTIVDASNFSVRVTLWGKQAENYAIPENPVIAFKGVKVGDFGGRSLSVQGSSSMTTSPDIPQAHELRGWFDNMDGSVNFQAHSNQGPSGAGGGTFNRSELRSLEEVKTAQVGMSDKVEYFSTRATVMHIKTDNIMYPGCHTCNKKVVDNGEGWRCEKCETSHEHPKYRYIMSMAVADWSGQAWLQGFNDVGEVLFGKTADEIQAIQQRDEAEFNVIMHKANGTTYNFTCRAKQDTYNEQTRVRYGVQKIMKLNYEEEACALRDMLYSPWGRA